MTYTVDQIKEKLATDNRLSDQTKTIIEELLKDRERMKVELVKIENGEGVGKMPTTGNPLEIAQWVIHGAQTFAKAALSDTEGGVK